MKVIYFLLFYLGVYCEGCPQGQGVFKYRDGRVLEGDWFEGQIHGKGILKLADGGVYEGEW